MKNEGIARDFIRHIQNFRKESELQVQDRIEVSLVSDDKIRAAIDENLDYIKNEILAVSIVHEVLNSTYSKKIEINGEAVQLGLSLANEEV